MPTRTSALTFVDRIDRECRDDNSCRARPRAALLPRWLATVGLIVQMATIAARCQAADESWKAAAAVLERRCVKCHQDAGPKGGLSLQSAAGIAAGGDSGATVAPGNADESLLLQMVTGTVPEMPRSGPPLTVEEVEALRRWVAAGARWPAEADLRDRGLPDNDWWSLRPIQRPQLPRLSEQDARWVQSPIDTFILARLREQGLGFSREADRATLIRRLHYDLIGLPPDPDEVAAFVADPDPHAYRRVVDRLLGSPHYGERWARHWLDVVHYGDTHGYDKDKPRPHAWPYRDYVIRALNADKPYSRFVEEQLAGDVLWPEAEEAIVATGFIAAGPWDFIGHAEVPETKIDGKVARHLDRDDMVVTTMNSFLSLTVQCAQCHDHKFDPVSQEHYYSLQAVFAALDRADRPYEPDAEIGRQRRELQRARARLAAEFQALEQQIQARAGAALVAVNRELAELEKPAALADDLPNYGYHSQIMPSPDRAKWVQVDLGESTVIDQIVYTGCWDAFNNIFHGFGFPPRYKIEISDDPRFASQVVKVLDRTAADEKNPGTQSLQVAVGGRKARYVRFTATKLALRKDDYIFALGELSVLSPDGQNLALRKSVTSLDSIEAPPRWARSNLVDGSFYGQRKNPGEQARIDRLKAERETLLQRATDAAWKRQLQENRAAAAQLEMQLAALPPPALVYCGCVHHGKGNFVGTGGSGGRPREIHLLERGNVQTPGVPMRPGAVPIIPGVDWQFPLPEDHREGDRRIALARWITRHDHPLTWRAIVNRVWQYHFGRGLVDSPNDFGRMGQLPTHPELLDWLAAEFRDGRQSLKDLHRLIVCSTTYRQVSTQEAVAEPNRPGPPVGARSPAANGNSSRAAALDAENRLLWRMNRRKLEAEAVRDAVLLVAGKLDPTMYGPAFQDFVIERPEHSPHYEYGKYNPDDARTHRRSIYRFLVRSQPQPFMDTLDCADPSQLVDKRNETLTALQALTLLNNRFMLRMSEHFADRVTAEHADTESRITAAFRLAVSRPPSAEELQELVAFVRQFGWPNACRVILNLNEFSFVD